MPTKLTISTRALRGKLRMDRQTEISPKTAAMELAIIYGLIAELDARLDEKTSAIESEMVRSRPYA